MIYDVLMVRGTGEVPGAADNMLRNVTDQLPPDRFNPALEVPYPASIGFANATWAVTGPSEDASRQLGVAALERMVAAAANKTVILGYSLGAEVVSDYRAAHGDDPKIAATACIANPLRAQADSIDSGSFGWGINGQHAPFTGSAPHWEAANPHDGIASCPPDSPLRTLADVVSAFGLAAIGGWGEDVIARLRSGRWQPDRLGWWQHPVKTWQLYATAEEDIRGYLTGQHTTAYVSGGYCNRLAAAIVAALGTT